MKFDYRKHNNNQRILSPFRLIPSKVKLKVLFFLGFVLVGLFFTQLVFANNLATDGQKMAQVQSDIKKLEAENMTLNAQIAQESSFANLSKEATEMGFRKPSKVTVIN